MTKTYLTLKEQLVVLDRLKELLVGPDADGRYLYRGDATDASVAEQLTAGGLNTTVANVKTVRKAAFGELAQPIAAPDIAARVLDLERRITEIEEVLTRSGRVSS